MRKPAQIWAFWCYQSSALKATHKRRASGDSIFWFSDASGEATGHPSYTKQTKPGIFTCLTTLLLIKCAAGQPLIPRRETRGCSDGELAEPTKDLCISLLFTFSPLRLFPGTPLDFWTARRVISVDTTVSKEGWIKVLEKNKRDP